MLISREIQDSIIASVDGVWTPFVIGNNILITAMTEFQGETKEVVDKVLAFTGIYQFFYPGVKVSVFKNDTMYIVHAKGSPEFINEFCINKNIILDSKTLLSSYLARLNTYHESDD